MGLPAEPFWGPELPEPPKQLWVSILGHSPRSPGPFRAGNPLPGLSPLSPQVGLMEVLVGKIFDLAFMPAMNGEHGAGAGDLGTWASCGGGT